MIPWPIALLTLFYGILAASSGASLWKIVIGASRQPFLWPLMWLAVSVGAMCGLALLRPWGRRLAIWASALLMVATLAVSALLVSAGRPVIGLMVALSASCHVMVIRYLQRPIVKALFEQGTAAGSAAKRG